MIVSLIAAITAFSAVALAGVWFVRRPHTQAEGRLRALGMANQTMSAGAYSGRIAIPEARDTGRRGSFLPASITRKAEARLARAGSPLTPSAFYSIVFLLMLGLPFLAFMLFVVVLGAGSGPILFLCIFLAVFGGYLPFLWLRTTVGSRQVVIRKGLPDILDLLTLCVESGLGLDAAFRRVAEETDGPLSHEISQMLHEVDLGKPRREALEDLAKRVDVPEIEVVVNAMIQSQQMGTSLSATLRSQTQLMRLRRRQRAEQSARQASVKMAFPLVMFLMPALFIIVIGPIGLQLVKALSD